MRAATFAAGRGGSAGPSLERSERGVYRSVVLRLAGLTALLLLLSQGALSFLLARTFEDTVLPEVRRKAEVAGGLATEQISYAVSLGIPLDALVGMDEFLQGVLNRNPDFTYLGVSTGDGSELYTQGTRAASARAADSLKLPIEAAGDTVGFLQIEVREGAVRSELAGLRFDIATAFLVTLLIGIELLVAFVVVRISGPIRLADRLIVRGARGNFLYRIGLRRRDEVGHVARAYNSVVQRVNTAFSMLTEEAEDARAVQIDRTIQQRIREVVTRLGERFRFTTPGLEQTVVPRSPMDVRIPLFLFMLAQELSRPFLPLFFGDVYTPIGNLSRELTIGLPFTTFMVVVLIATPIAGAITDRFGPRTLFILGIVPSVAGHIGAALSTTIIEALLWWTLAGLGYGTIFIAAQTYVAHHAEASRRAVGMTGFTGAFFAAFVCGPAMGGILADRLGYRNTLLVAAVMATFAAGAALIAVDRDSQPEKRPRLQSMRSLRRVFAQREFVVLTLFSAVPNKLILSGLYFFLLPLFLADLGNSQSNIGRVLMVFGIACIAVTPLAASGADRSGRPRTFIVLGGLVSGLGCLLPTLIGSTAGVVAAAAVLGTGQALTTAPQLAVVQRIAEHGRDFGVGPGAIVGAFRTVERIGTAAGALAVAAVVTLVGYGRAMLIIGVLVFFCTVCYLLFGAAAGKRPDNQGGEAVAQPAGEPAGKPVGVRA
jgi:predicted MFS family arabinose efflux permease